MHTRVLQCFYAFGKFKHITLKDKKKQKRNCKEVLSNLFLEIYNSVNHAVYNVNFYSQLTNATDKINGNTYQLKNQAAKSI